MVTFLPSWNNGVAVMDDSMEEIGRCHKEGFFLGRDRLDTGLSAEVLRIIVLKQDEVERFGGGDAIPVCPHCGGTPNFPGQVCYPNEGEDTCCNPIHHSKR